MRASKKKLQSAEKVKGGRCDLPLKEEKSQRKIKQKKLSF